MKMLNGEASLPLVAGVFWPLLMCDIIGQLFVSHAALLLCLLPCPVALKHQPGLGLPDTPPRPYLTWFCSDLVCNKVTFCYTGSQELNIEAERKHNRPVAGTLLLLLLLFN